jgi:RNA polymerase sigma factor (sigma-70 family)
LNHTEPEIVAGCVRNERKYQEILYRRHFAAMMQMCMRYANGDKERALEIVNDGFLRVFKKIESFGFKGSLEGWIRRIVFHAISDYFKQNQTYLDNIVLNDALPEAKTGVNTEGGLSNLYYDDLVKMIDVLPPATREVFRLYAIEGFNHAEIGEQLHISVGTSKWHLSAAREQLKKILNKTTVVVNN